MSADATSMIRRRVGPGNTSSSDTLPEESISVDRTDSTFTLMEEVFLLGLKDKQGYTSFWNDCLSAGLRGCILAELVLRQRIAIEKGNRRKVGLYLRKVHVINPSNTGDALLDEALKHINDTHPHEDLYSWIHYFSGE